MLNKKIILVTLLITSLIFVTTASAAENTTDNTVCIEENNDVLSVGMADEIINTEEQTNLSNYDNNKLSTFIWNGPIDDLYNIKSEINNADKELVLDKDYFNNGKPVTIEKQIIIDGNNHIITGFGESKAFNVKKDNVTLKNIQFINCTSQDKRWHGDFYGGAITWTGNNGKLINCTFENCYFEVEEISNAGAILWLGNNGIIDNCTFINCYCEYNPYTYGGAITWTGKNGKINNSEFINCSASYAGSIYLNGSNCIISNTDFDNSIATIGYVNHQYGGGALYWDGVNGILKNNTFKKCGYEFVDLTRGGALYWNASGGFIDNCQFIDCSGADKINTYHYCYGGAIYWNGEKGKLTNSIFNNCSLIYGGAIYWLGDNSILHDNKFIECFVKNDLTTYSSTSGGAIFFSGHNSLIYDCDFIDCYSIAKSSNTDVSSHGGAIACYGDNCTLFDCNFTNCYSFAPYLIAKSYGGSVFWDGDDGKLFNCIFINSTASVSNKDTATFHSANVVYSYGGGVCWSGKNGSLNNCDFINCLSNASHTEASAYGGGVHWSGIDGNISNCNFINCTSITPHDSTYGGAFSIDYGYYSKRIINISNCKFINNKASYGGAIYSTGNYNNFLYMSDCIFITNLTKLGKSIHIKNTILTLNNTKFSSDNENIYSYQSKISLNSKPIRFVVENVSFDYKSPKKIYILLTDDENNTFYNYTINVKLIKDTVTKNFILKTDNKGLVVLYGELLNLDAGLWNLTLEFNGNDNYNPSKSESIINIHPLNTSMTISNVNSTTGSNENLIVKLNSNNIINEGIVKFFINNNYIGQSDVIDSTATLNYYFTTAINGTLKAIFENNNNYLNNSATSNIFINGAFLKINYDNVILRKNTKISVNVVDSNNKLINNGQIQFYIDNNLVKTVNINKGNAYLDYSFNNAGRYNIKAILINNNQFMDTESSSYITIDKLTTKISTIDITSDWGKYITLTSKINSNTLTVNEGIVSYYINNKLIGEAHVVDGSATLKYLPTDTGNFTIRSVYNSNNNFFSSNCNSILSINKATTQISFEKINNVSYNDTIHFNIKINSDNIVNDGIIRSYINDKLISTLYVINGNISFDYSPSNAGAFNLKVIYENSTHYLNSIGDYSFNVNKQPTVVHAQDINVVYNTNQYLIISLKDNHGNAINDATMSISLNGIKTISTDKYGQVKLTTVGLSPKKYVVAITFDGNNNYEKSSTTVNLVVKKATPKITAKSITFKKSVKTKKYSITLKNNLNKVMKNTKITIKVNKKTYSAKTNSKGVATFKITKLTKKGTFKSVITYKGDKYYNKVTKTINIKVK